MVITFIACHRQGNITHHRETLKQHHLDVKIITFILTSRINYCHITKNDDKTKALSLTVFRELQIDLRIFPVRQSVIDHDVETLLFLCHVKRNSSASETPIYHRSIEITNEFVRCTRYNRIYGEDKLTNGR